MTTRFRPRLLATALLGLTMAAPLAAEPPAPTTKELWQLLFRHHTLPLRSAAHCRGAGTDAADATLGAYLSGFLAQLDEPGDNRILGRCAAGGGERWQCELTIGHKASDSELRWRWGVRFDVRRADRALLPATLVCTGAG